MRKQCKVEREGVAVERYGQGKVVATTHSLCYKEYVEHIYIQFMH